MDHLHLDKLTPANLGVFAVGVVLTWLLYKATKHLVAAFICLVIAVLGAGYVTGVISPRTTLEEARSAGKRSLEAVEAEAKAIRERAAREAHEPDAKSDDAGQTR